MNLMQPGKIALYSRGAFFPINLVDKQKQLIGLPEIAQ